MPENNDDYVIENYQKGMQAKTKLTILSAHVVEFFLSHNGVMHRSQWWVWRLATGGGLVRFITRDLSEHGIGRRYQRDDDLLFLQRCLLNGGQFENETRRL